MIKQFAHWKSSDLYTSISPNITENFQLLKKNLFKGFCKTPDGYRVELRNCKIKPEETYVQFVVKLGHKFDL